ncbi:MAG TPA: DsbE family thiol:disulfide interchange protein [Xanthomonadaceae bacterium]|nr:DsbE family thiol:disulfide interchange protein [Xanthomonadaceae bacterium]
MKSGLSRWLPLLLFAGLAVLLYAGVRLSGRADRDALPSPLIGKRAPSFALPVLHEPQRIFRSSELRGAPYVLNVWGSWCPECQTEHDVLTTFAETKRVRVIGYNWKDEPADALRWLQRFGNPYWLVLADLPGRTAIDFGIYGAPETFLIDGRGMVRWKHVGPLNETIIRQELIPALQRAERTQ